MNIIKVLKNTTPAKDQNLTHLRTKWSDIDEDHVWEEYPRMQLQRDAYMSLNGKWDFGITKSKDNCSFDSKIIVPFCPESLLSSVQQLILPEDYMWYKKNFKMAVDRNKKYILHFEAVDQVCEIYLNEKKVYGHEGGYTSFEIDITSVIQEENELIVCVQDFSDTKMFSRGKQRMHRGGMWYTPVSGIWQSVWIEWVEQNYILNIDYEIHSDLNGLTLTVYSPQRAKITVVVDQQMIIGNSNEKLNIALKNPHYWDTEDPYLYDVQIEMGNDKVKSYFGLRTITKEKDKDGFYKVFLNHKPIFVHGLLDQGYWSDGILTPPCDEALVYDIECMKSHGFNTLRKHIKMEMNRFYYHCDRLGMLVIQDMVNGGSSYNDTIITSLPTLFPRMWNHYSDCKHDLSCRNDQMKQNWIEECEINIQRLKTHPSIIAWCLFNEGWGQFQSASLTQRIHKLDSSRLIDSTSGWFDQGCGDFKSLHIYFRKLFVPKLDERIFIISEYGGYSWNVKDHSALKSAYGYARYTNKEDLNKACEMLMKEAKELINQGLAGLIYTQVSDVEEEVNGILTYDRKVDKMEKNTFKI